MADHKTNSESIKTQRFLRFSLAFVVAIGAAFSALGSGFVAHAETQVSEEPPRKLNPAPTRGYEITVNLADAPGPFVFVRGEAQYDAENYPRCGRIIRLAGVITPVTSHEEIKLTKISETTYRGTVYADQIIDESYYGRDVCRWKLTAVSASFMGKPENVATRYIMSLRADAVEAQGSDTRYYWKGYYPRAKMERFVTFGDNSLQDDVIRAHGDEFFTVTMRAKALKL